MSKRQTGRQTDRLLETDRQERLTERRVTDRDQGERKTDKHKDHKD